MNTEQSEEIKPQLSMKGSLLEQSVTVPTAMLEMFPCLFSWDLGTPAENPWDISRRSPGRQHSPCGLRLNFSSFFSRNMGFY